MRLAVLLFSALLFARPAELNAAPGRTTANFLRIGVAARPVALGESFTAIADDVNSLYYNPAGLATLVRQEATFMHNEFLPGVNHEWAAYALPTRRLGTFALGATYLSVDKFDSFDRFDQPVGTVDAADMAGTAGWGIEFGEKRRLALGGAAKFVRSRLATYRADAVAFDAGFLMLSDDFGTWRFGAAVRNVGSKMKFIDEEFFLPLTGHVGVAYFSPLPHPVDYLKVTWTAEANGSYDRNPWVSGGFELELPLKVVFRGGYRGNQDLGLGVAGGIGVRSLEESFTGRWWPEIQLDYTFVDFGALSNTHRVTVTLRFGPKKTGEYDIPVRAEELRFY